MKESESESRSGLSDSCEPMDSIVHGILQARILEWVIVPFSRESTVRGILQARILECIAFPFSKGIFPTRDRTEISHFAAWFFPSWATKEAQE